MFCAVNFVTVPCTYFENFTLEINKNNFKLALCGFYILDVLNLWFPPNRGSKFLLWFSL